MEQPPLAALLTCLWNLQGGSVLRIAGVNLNELDWHPETQVLQQRDSVCEFGSPTEPLLYMYDDQLTFNDQTCEIIQVGFPTVARRLGVELYTRRDALLSGSLLACRPLGGARCEQPPVQDECERV